MGKGGRGTEEVSEGEKEGERVCLRGAPLERDEGDGRGALKKEFEL